MKKEEPLKDLSYFGLNYELEEKGNSQQVISLISLEKLTTIPEKNKLPSEEYIKRWINKLSFSALYRKRLGVIAKKEKAVFQLVKDKEIKGTRVCYFKEKDGKEWIDCVRFELAYIDNTVIKIPEILYYLYPTKLEDKYSNF